MNELVNSAAEIFHNLQLIVRIAVSAAAVCGGAYFYFKKSGGTGKSLAYLGGGIAVAVVIINFVMLTNSADQKFHEIPGVSSGSVGRGW